MAEELIQFYLSIDEVEAYCYAESADERQNIICISKLRFLGLTIYVFKLE
jgi:hypothetical protein